MGTTVDFAYRLEGQAEDLAKARVAIKAYQAKNANCSGNGNHDFGLEPTTKRGGAMTWHCYSTRETDGFDASVLTLTATSGLRCFAYWGCTDGDSDSGLNLFKRVKAVGSGKWKADIGLNAAWALHRRSRHVHQPDSRSRPPG